MEAQYFAQHAIHHGRRDHGLGKHTTIVIAVGMFSPSALGLTEDEVARMHARGLILTIAEQEAAEVRRRQLNQGGQLMVNGVGANLRVWKR